MLEIINQPRDVEKCQQPRDVEVSTTYPSSKYIIFNVIYQNTKAEYGRKCFPGTIKNINNRNHRHDKIGTFEIDQQCCWVPKKLYNIRSLCRRWISDNLCANI